MIEHGFRWERLRELIRQHALQRGQFVLSSGRASTYLFQLRQITLLAEGSAILARIILEYMEKQGFTCLGGPEVGAIPIVAAVVSLSYSRGSFVDAFFIRKKSKKHGALEQIDGHVREGAHILLVDDVATTGASILLAKDGLKDLDCQVRQAFVIIDREEGATENLAEHGLQLVSLFRTSDFPEIIIPSEEDLDFEIAMRRRGKDAGDSLNDIAKKYDL